MTHPSLLKESCDTFLFCLALVATQSVAQQKEFYISANRVFDGEVMYTKTGLLWWVAIKSLRLPKKIKNQNSSRRYCNQQTKLNTSARFDWRTLAHVAVSHNITDWDTQVLKESDSYRTARATVHAKNTLLAGFTTARDLGNLGGAYSDVAWSEPSTKV